MSVVCQYYVGFMSVLCQYVKLYFIELQKYIMILCRMSVTFADFIICSVLNKLTKFEFNL